jgi:hypothetical protein
MDNVELTRSWIRRQLPLAGSRLFVFGSRVTGACTSYQVSRCRHRASSKLSSTVKSISLIALSAIESSTCSDTELTVKRSNGRWSRTLKGNQLALLNFLLMYAHASGYHLTCFIYFLLLENLPNLYHPALRSQRLDIRTPRPPLHQNLTHHLARPRRITNPPTTMPARHKDTPLARDGPDEGCSAGREGEEACLFCSDGGVC